MLKFISLMIIWSTVLDGSITKLLALVALSVIWDPMAMNIKLYLLQHKLDKLNNKKGDN